MNGTQPTEWDKYRIPTETEPTLSEEQKPEDYNAFLEGLRPGPITTKEQTKIDITVDMATQAMVNRAFTWEKPKDTTYYEKFLYFIDNSFVGNVGKRFGGGFDPFFEKRIEKLKKEKPGITDIELEDDIVLRQYYLQRDKGRELDKLKANVEGKVAERSKWDPRNFLFQGLKFGFELPAWYTGGRLSSPIAAKAAEKFTLKRTGLEGLKKSSAYAAELPMAIHYLSKMGGTFGFAGALTKYAEPEGSFKDAMTAMQLDAELGVMVGLAGRAAKYVNPKHARWMRQVAPFAAEATTMGAWPDLREGRMFDPANVAMAAAMLGPIHAVMWTRGDVSRMARAEVESYFEYSEGGHKVRGELKDPDGPFDLNKIFNNMKEKPELIAKFRHFKPESYSSLSDRLWYEAVKIVSPEYARIIGIKRGVLKSPSSVEKHFIESIQSIRKAAKIPLKEIKETYFEGRSLNDIRRGKFSYNELEAIQERMLQDMVGQGKFKPIPKQLSDPYEKIKQFYYYTGKETPRQVLEVVPIDQKIKWQLQPEITLPEVFRSPRYALDGTNIEPDVTRAADHVQDTLNLLVSEINSTMKLGQGKVNGKRVIEYSKTINPKTGEGSYIEGMTINEVKIGKLGREVFDYYVQDPRVAEAFGLMVESGGIRKWKDYWTAMQDAIKRSMKAEDITLFEKLPKSVRVGALQKRGKFAIEKEDVLKTLVAYVYAAEKKINVEPALKRSMARASYLPPKKQKYATKHLRRVMNIQDDLQPDWWTGLTRGIASRVYVGALGMSPGTALRNTTQFGPAAVLIGPEWIASGIKNLFTDSKAAQRAKEAGVSKEWIREYMEGAPAFTPTRRLWTAINNGNMAMFGGAERLLREGTYTGAYNKMMKQGNKTDFKWARNDIKELINQHLKAGDMAKAADVFGKEAALHSQYAYTKHQSAPWLKTALGRTAGQFMSYPFYTGEMWVQTMLHGDPKRTAEMLAIHPMFIAAGRPLGISMAGFMGLGLLPHASPTAQFALTATNLVEAYKKNDLKDIDRYLDEMEKLAWLGVPGGRMLRTRLKDFHHDMKYGRLPSGQLRTMNPETGKWQFTTMRKQLFKLMDLYPWGDAKDREVARYIYQKGENKNYLSGKGYREWSKALFYEGGGHSEKAAEHLEEAMVNFSKVDAMYLDDERGLEQAKKTRAKTIDNMKLFWGMPETLRAMLKDSTAAAYAIHQMPLEMQEDMWDIIESFLIDRMGGTIPEDEQEMLFGTGGD